MGDRPSYQDLVIWQRAIELVPVVYATVKCFPKHEQFAMSDQMRRAVVSIAANIAEGQARQHQKEFLQYLSIARGSLAELHTLLIVAQRLQYISPDQLKHIELLLGEIRKPLRGLAIKLSGPAP